MNPVAVLEAFAKFHVNIGQTLDERWLQLFQIKK